jgi:hypothetical protein
MDFDTEFNTNPQAPQRAELSPGRYICELVGEVTKPTKRGDGEYLELTWQVHQPRHGAGAKIIDRLNLKNPTAKAVAIANETLTSICNAGQIARPRASAELIGVFVEILVENEEYNGKIYSRAKSYSVPPAESRNKSTATQDEILDNMPF